MSRSRRRSSSRCSSSPREAGTALIWITRDPALIAGLADRVAVMYAGRIVEQGYTEDVLRAPRHPYTRGLLDSMPGSAPRHEKFRQIAGMTPIAHRPSAGLRISAALPVRDRRMRTDSRDARRTGRPARACAAFIRCRRRREAMIAAAERNDVAPLLELKAVSKRFVAHLDLVSRIASLCRSRCDARSSCYAVDRVRSGDRGRRGRRPGWRIGLRQVDPGAACGRAPPAVRGRAPLARRALR